jgi:CHRD domain
MKLSMSNISIRPCLLALASVLILPMPASYADTVLTANLTGALEIPSNGSTATGTAVITLEPGDMMRVQVTFSGLTSGTTASHIHCCLPAPFQNANEPVGTTIPTFPGFPLGVTSGTYDQTFDLTANSTYNLINMPPGNAGNSFLGTSAATAEPVFVAALLAGETYHNVPKRRDSGTLGRTRSCRGRGSAGADCRLRWPSRLVATAADEKWLCCSRSCLSKTPDRISERPPSRRSFLLRVVSTHARPAYRPIILEVVANNHRSGHRAC